MAHNVSNNVCRINIISLSSRSTSSVNARFSIMSEQTHRDSFNQTYVRSPENLNIPQSSSKIPYHDFTNLLRRHPVCRLHTYRNGGGT